jgi:hypothetical protein
MGAGAIHLPSSPHAVCSHKSGTARAVRCRHPFASLRDEHILTPRRKENGDTGITTVLAGPSAIGCQTSALSCPPVSPGGGRRGASLFLRGPFYASRGIVNAKRCEPAALANGPVSFLHPSRSSKPQATTCRPFRALFVFGHRPWARAPWQHHAAPFGAEPTAIAHNG